MMFDCSDFHLGHVTLKEVEMQVSDIYKITEVSDVFYTHVHMYAHKYTHMHVCARVYVCACARTHAHTHTHTHTHKRVYVLCCVT